MSSSKRAARRGSSQVRASAAALVLQLVADALAFVQAAQACALDRADVHEDVLAAFLRLDETEAFSGVEPLDRAVRHFGISL